MECCGTCKFWEKLPRESEGFNSGSCRRYPPQLNGVFYLLRDHELPCGVSETSPYTTESNFPETEVEEWCGEWRQATSTTESLRGRAGVIAELAMAYREVHMLTRKLGSAEVGDWKQHYSNAVAAANAFRNCCKAKMPAINARCISALQNAFINGVPPHEIASWDVAQWRDDGACGKDTAERIATCIASIPD